MCESGCTMPIIGILSQETISLESRNLPKGLYRSYIAASYVKFVESAGARVVPIWIGRDREYYRQVVKKTNGILFPGGATWFHEEKGYGEAGGFIYEMAVEENKAGKHFPLLGICLGMELMLYLEAKRDQQLQSDCDSFRVSLPLHFVEGYQKSKLFSNASDDIIDILSTKDVTLNSHRFCITPEKFTEYSLHESFQCLSTNTDLNGLVFISSYESIKYPFYGLQFHPEKNAFEFVASQAGYVNHSKEAVAVTQYFANFFVDQARENKNSFSSVDEEDRNLIYNYNPLFYSLLGGNMQQIYVFNEEENRKEIIIEKEENI